jgi:hypothetical protein
MSEAKLVKALWVGPYEAQLPDGRVLVPGETVVDIGAGEASESDHWEPVRAAAPKPKKDKD